MSAAIVLHEGISHFDLVLVEPAPARYRPCEPIYIYIWLGTGEALLHVGSLVVPLCFTVVDHWWLPERIGLRTCEALLHVGSLVVPLCFIGGSLVVTWWFLGGLICGSFV